MAPSTPLTRSEARRPGRFANSIILAALVASGCSSAPLTGRRQLVIIPESQEILLGAQAYEQSLVDEPMSEDGRLIEMVNRVGRRIAAVADKPDYDWEFRVIAKDVMNAFALPGGKVAVYEGIIPVCQDEAGLAVVISHEVAHALARHGAERMSQESIATGVGGIIDGIGQKQTDPVTAERISRAYGAASKFGVLLPYSRKHESEADAIGLILMAKAGYDPSAAPEFWERFSHLSGAQPPEWLSTHPADARRAADLRAMLPEAMNYYRAAPQQIGLGDALPIPVRRPASLADRSTALAAKPEGGPGFATVFATTSEPEPGVATFAAAATPETQRDVFRLPAVPVRPSSATAGNRSDPQRFDSTVDDGWYPARGHAPHEPELRTP